jgi:hypothetical protein
MRWRARSGGEAAPRAHVLHGAHQGFERRRLCITDRCGAIMRTVNESAPV